MPFFLRMKRLPIKGIGTGLILAGLLFLTFYIRIQGVERIPDGQFTGNDAYLFYKHAQTIAEQGYLPARDMDRWLPLGRDNGQFLSLYAYAIAYTHKIFPWVSVYDIQHYSPAVCFTLAIGVLFLFFAQCYGVMFASNYGRDPCDAPR
jgi:asparagine N-glycosylation enzyme membrane subunit Stt3